MYVTETTGKKRKQILRESHAPETDSLSVLFFVILLFSYPLGEVTWSYLTGHLCNVISG